jgi:LuxR family transcriptional regulator, maltose regulon positive regulatory protein
VGRWLRPRIVALRTRFGVPLAIDALFQGEMAGSDEKWADAGDDVVRGGYEALSRWDWPRALELFEKALAQEETPEAFGGLGAAASWLDDARLAISSHERAYRMYRDRGDAEGGARAAVALADNLLTFRGDSAVASGWLGRSRRMLERCPESPLHALVDVLEGYLAMAYERDSARARELTKRAVEVSRACGDSNTEMVAAALYGLVLVTQGAFAEGMRMLDDATAASVVGDISDPESAANVCCTMVTTAVRTRDFDRLDQWSRTAMELSRGWSNRATFSYPRTEHATALMWWGRWEQAERELLGVIDDMANRPLVAALAILRLAELRRGQGRLDEAIALVEQLDQQPGRVGMGHLTDAVRAAVMLDRGDAQEAADIAERYLRAVPVDDLLERADGLEVLAAATAALGELDRAAEAAAELGRIAQQVPTAAMRAAGRRAAGVAAAAGGDHLTARAAFEEAVPLYAESGAAIETARTRMELARSLAVLRKTNAAERELRAAVHTLDTLGAARWAKTASDLLAGIGSPTTRQASGHPLTPREVEVLRLVAGGRSNEEIATTLVLSLRTVERHISNLYTKIGASGRTARAVATAYAHSHGLTQSEP